MHRLARLSGAVLLIVGMTACAGSPDPTPAPSDGGLEHPEISVGVLPIADVAPVYVAISRGLFDAEGLIVRAVLVQGGAAAIPALQGGDLQFSYGNWVSFLLANQEGIDLRAVADGVAAAPGFTELLAMPDSGLVDDPAGLGGTTIAVNTLNNIGELAIRSTLRDNGIPFEDVQLIEIPFPDMGATLERGDVDVIWASEPVPTVVKTDLGAVTVVDSFIGEMEGFPVAGYQATADFVAANPGTVAAFQRALAAAVEIIHEDPDIVREVLLGYTNLEPEIADEIALPSYQSGLEPATLQRVADYLIEFEMLEPGLEVDELVAPEAEIE